MNKYKYYFGSGPSKIPKIVKKRLEASIKNYPPAGISILEVNHRTKPFVDIIEATKISLKRLLGLGDDYEILFLQGGASQQFWQFPLNYLKSKDQADYINTGIWSSKAIKIAKNYAKINVIASSEDKNFSYIPKHFSVTSDSSYLHITSNNTIYGTQWHTYPEVDIPIIVDMSSDIISRDMDYSQFSFIYAGAQKNLGISGLAMIAYEKNVFTKVNNTIPPILDYGFITENNSLINTPPIFAIYSCYEMLKWIEENGGVEVFATENKYKSQMLYDFLDQSNLYIPTAQKDSRSQSNVCFVLQNPDLEDKLLSHSLEKGIYGIQGHRSIGGFRVALYNSIAIDDIHYLISFLEKFEQKYG